MLISFSVENWMSFRDMSTLSLVATQESQHDDRVAEIEKYKTKLLPVAAIYGGNASGKSNFFQALCFVKDICVQGSGIDASINAQPFLLDDKEEEPSQFIFELLIDETVYEFSIAVTRQQVVEEKLVAVLSDTEEKVLYHRYDGEIHLHDSLKEDPFFDFAAKGTRENQLFLTNTIALNNNTFRPVYNWFKYKLVLIAPSAYFGSFEQFIGESNQLYLSMSEILQQLDTGILHLGSEEIDFEKVSLPELLKKELQKKVSDNQSVRLLIEPFNGRFVVTRKNGKLIFKKLVTYHRKADGSEVMFDLIQESDGSLRLIDLLPAFLDLSGDNTGKVYVIDEFDRSMHALLTRSLLEAYLDKCSATTRKQLLLTTHDVLLIDQQLLRRDEMWVTDRDASGASSLYSFSAFEEAPYDKNIRKSYLQGRMGGIPRIFMGSLGL